MLLHKHHIIPRHEWKKRFGNFDGFDDPDNTVMLTIDQHAECHKWLWEEYKNEEDMIAWLGLSGQAPKQEITMMLLKSKSRRERISSSKKEYWKSSSNRERLSASNPMHNPEVLEKMSGQNHWSKREGRVHNWVTNNPMKNPDVAKKVSGNLHWSKRPGKIHNAKVNHPKGSSKKIMIDGIVYNTIKEACEKLKMDPRKVKKIGTILQKEVSCCEL